MEHLQNIRQQCLVTYILFISCSSPLLRTLSIFEYSNLLIFSFSYSTFYLFMFIFLLSSHFSTFYLFLTYSTMFSIFLISFISYSVIYFFSHTLSSPLLRPISYSVHTLSSLSLPLSSSSYFFSFLFLYHQSHVIFLYYFISQACASYTLTLLFPYLLLLECQSHTLLTLSLSILIYSCLNILSSTRPNSPILYYNLLYLKIHCGSLTNLLILNHSRIPYS